MADAEISFSSDDDDDLILELTHKPPRFTQGENAVSTQLNDNSYTQLGETANNGNIDSLQNDKLTKAYGETSILRAKISMLEAQIEKEKKNQSNEIAKLRDYNNNEIAKLKSTIQSLKDDKKILQIENKTSKLKTETNNQNSNIYHNFHSNVRTNKKNDETSDYTETSYIPQVDLKTTSLPTAIKKRKFLANTTLDSDGKTLDVVPLNLNNVIADEKSEFYDHIMSHKLIGVELNTMEILNHLKLGSMQFFQHKQFIIDVDCSIGESLQKLLLQLKQNLSLDICIDLLLEYIGTLIARIMDNKDESNLPIPFLVIIMYQVITFRPSAVSINSLKECFSFSCDLIRKNQHILNFFKEDEYSNIEKYLEPQIFQYEFIDNLNIIFAFDLLEVIFRVLQSHNPSDYEGFLTKDIFIKMESIYKNAISDSRKPIMNIIFNLIEVFNMLTNMLLSLKNNDKFIVDINDIVNASWWVNCCKRLYIILRYHMKSLMVPTDIENEFEKLNISFRTTTISSSSFSKRKFFNIFGLIRNMGDNSWSKLICQLIYKDKLQSNPRVISKDNDLIFKKVESDYISENWIIRLKRNILIILGNLINIYPYDLLSGDKNNKYLDDSSTDKDELFIILSQLLASEQDQVVNKLTNNDNPNIIERVKFIEHSVDILYELLVLQKANINDLSIKKVESELVTSLWRIIVSRMDENNRDIDNMKNHRHLVDESHELTLNDMKLYYEDAFEDMPNYIAEELSVQLEKRSNIIMHVRYDQIYQDMAQTILEQKFTNFISMEETDSLYMAMGL